MAKAARLRRSRPFVPSWQPRERPLLVLEDRGRGRPVSPSLFGVGGRDRSWNAHAENFIATNRPLLSSLDVEAELAPTANEISLRLRPGGTLGAVPLRRPDTHGVAGGVVVRPRFGWNGIGPLLGRVGWGAAPTVLDHPLVPGSAREVPPWVLAGPVLDRLARLLSEVRRGFRLVEELRAFPRGQILWQRYASEQLTRGALHHIPCRFPELGPDLLLRSYLRWGIEAVHRSLVPFAVVDLLARALVDQAETLLVGLTDVPARPPDRTRLEQVSRMAGLPSAVLRRGLEALGWIVDERGLAGQSETDGLSWCLPMSSLFERWVEHLVRFWAHGWGGEVLSAQASETALSIPWNRGGMSSLKSLVPDLVLRRGRDIVIVDAKYKGHFQELDQERWTALAAELRAEHRQDVHQALAYAALFDGATVTTMLVYPMLATSWDRLASLERTIATAAITGGGRRVDLVLAAVPLELAPERGEQEIVSSWAAAVWPTT